MTPMQPVSPRERVVVIDVLRGVALFGIIVANMRGFSAPVEAYFHPDSFWSSTSARIVTALIDCFVTAKFITIFGILFGLGFAMQLERAARSAADFGAIWTKRMLVLAAFGGVHIVFFWWGDILLAYAVVGILLLLVYRNFDESLLMWAILIYWFPVVAYLGMSVLQPAGITGDSAVPASAIEETIRVYTAGGFWEVLRLRLVEWSKFNSSWPYSLARILSFFLFGAWLWKAKLFQDPAPLLPHLRRALPALLAAGLTGNAAYVAINSHITANPSAHFYWTALLWVSSSIGVPALSLFYITGTLLLFRTGTGKRLLNPFASVGRMALTSYLLQTVICTFIFYGHGLGLFGQASPLQGLLLALVIYSVQVVLCGWWTRRYRFGPAEWLWRSLVYGETPRFRV